MEGNLRFKIDWASLIVGRKVTPVGAYIWRGDLTEGFFAFRVWGVSPWRGLFSEFYGMPFIM